MYQWHEVEEQVSQDRQSLFWENFTNISKYGLLKNLPNILNVKTFVSVLLKSCQSFVRNFSLSHWRKAQIYIYFLVSRKTELISSLYALSNIERDICKQCRLRSDDAECGV